MTPRHLEQIETIAEKYRAAFDRVATLLTLRSDGALPGFVFALDPMDVAQIATLDPEVARAEQHRRQWRACLHAMTELAALAVGGSEEVLSAVDTLDPEDFDRAMSGESARPRIPTPESGQPGLDRFISVLQFARSSGCMYVDGAFEPVLKGRR